MACDNEDRPRIKRLKTSAVGIPRSDILDTFDKQIEDGDIYPADFFVLPDRTPSAESLIRRISARRAINTAALAELHPDPSIETLRRDLKASALLPMEKKSTIGFLGCPGHGKSSLINALVSVPDFLPADSSGDSCTATPTSIEYNDDPEHAFHAEINYIGEEEWLEDILSALDDLIDAEETKDTEEALSLSGLAFTKFKAVYPSLPDASLYESVGEIAKAENDPAKQALQKQILAKKILASNDVGKLLGTRKLFVSNDARNFRKDLHKTLRSVMIGQTGNFGSGEAILEKRWVNTPSTWPVIHSVTLRVRSPLLKGGAVLVDIPGINDSNKAKSIRAEDAINKCDAIVIVREAARVLSDPTMQDLLDKALRLVHYGGHVDRVMLVNTKSDDFEAHQGRDQYESEDITKHRNEYDKAKDDVRKVEAEIADRQAEYQDKESAFKKIKREENKWKGMQTQCNKGKDVYASIIGEDGKLLKSEPGQPPLKIDEIKAKLKEIRKKRDIDKDVINDLGEEIKRRRTSLTTAKGIVMSKKLDVDGSIFEARNQKIKKVQAESFVRKVRLRDEELSEMAKQQKFHLNSELTDIVTFRRDYKKLERELAIFCVSARAFQYLNGDTKSKAMKYTIKDVEHTEMFALAQHLFRIAADAQYENLQKVNNEVEAVYQSLRLHVEEDIELKSVDETEALKALNQASSLLAAIPTKCDLIIMSTFDRIAMKYQKFMTKLPEIKERVAKRAEIRLDDHRTTNENAKTKLRYMELRAAVRRYGIWTLGRRGLNINFNRDVKEIFDATLSVAMHQLFISEDDRASCKLALKLCCDELAKVFDCLRTSMASCNTLTAVNAAATKRLEEQYLRRQHTLRAITSSTVRHLEVSHVEAGSGMAKEIQEAWTPAYDEARKVSGGGAMVGVIDILCHALLNEDKLHVPSITFKNRLQEKINAARQFLLAEVQKLIESVTSDYQTALSQRVRFSKCNRNPALAKIRHKLLPEDTEFDEGDSVSKVKVEESETDEDESDVFVASSDEEDVEGHVSDWCE